MNVPEYHVNLVQLKPKLHHFSFALDDAFFAEAAAAPGTEALVEHAAVKADVTLDRTERMIRANFHLRGTVVLTCDRSLEAFDYPLDHHYEVIFQFGEEYAEIDDALIVIPRTWQVLDLRQHLYDFVNLSIPMKKVHPKYADAEPLVYRSEADDDPEQPEVDPRWAALQALKKNQN